MKMSFDNSFDPMDIYQEQEYDYNYYDDIVDMRERPERERVQEQFEREIRTRFEQREGVDFSYDPTLELIEQRGWKVLQETFEDVVQEEREQPREHQETIAPSTSAPTIRSTVFFKQDIRKNHWF